MRLWLMVTVAAVALTACTNAAILGPDSDNEGEMAGNTALFCRAWPEAKRTVIDMLEGEDQRFLDARNAAVVDDTMATYDRAVPSEIRTEWDRFYDTYTRASDLTFTVGYAGHTIRAEHFAMMFGPGGMESVMNDAATAIEAIDEWSVTACGDFCSRWPELRNAVLVEPTHWLFEGWHEDIEQLIETEEAAIHVGSMLVPSGIADAWETAAILKSRFLAMGRQYGPSVFQGEEGIQRLIDGMGMSDEAMYEASLSAVETMAVWTAANCDPTTLTGGAPGSLSVSIRPRDDLVGRTILLALLPVGIDFGSVSGPDEYLGALCPEMGESPGVFDRELERTIKESGRSEDEILDEWLRGEPLRPIINVGEYHEGSICNLLQYEEGGGGGLVVPGGAYELFAGTFIGGPGSYDLYFAAPERCAQVTVNVDGDTVVDPPELDECDLEPIGSVEEIARRPSTPPTGDSRLWVELPDALHREESPGYFTAVLLPAGTTLGEIGRGDAWPVGGVNFGYTWFGDDEGDPQRTRRASESGLVPILPYGMGGGVQAIQSPRDSQEPWDAFFPEPVALDPGIYDLRIYGEWGEEDCDDDSCRRESCGSVAIEVNGDTIVQMPEWGECP
jgi:hypothetical protein